MTDSSPGHKYTIGLGIFKSDLLTKNVLKTRQP